MASLSFVESELNALPPALKPIFLRIFRNILKDLRFGHPTGDAADPAVNFGAGFFHGTTPSTPGDEFTIAHGFGRVPYLALPVLRLDAVGSSTVPLTVSTVADDKRVFFTSTEADAPISVLVEG